MTEFEWDEVKEEANIRKHGIDFTTAVAAFADPLRRIIPDDRFEYGEPRSIAFGEVHSVLYMIVHANRGDAVRIISARRATRGERRSYGNRS